METVIINNELTIRKLNDTDKNILLDWLTNLSVLKYWEGKSAVFDMNRIEEDFYSSEACEMQRCIIEFNDTPIGYIQMYLADEILDEYEYENFDKNVYALDLFIADEEYRNRGIGTKLLNLVKGYLKNLGARVLIVDPHCDNLRAVHTYNKVGFEIVKTLKEHEMHDNIMVDCYLMECIL